MLPPPGLTTIANLCRANPRRKAAIAVTRSKRMRIAPANAHSSHELDALSPYTECCSRLGLVRNLGVLKMGHLGSPGPLPKRRFERGE